MRKVIGNTTFIIIGVFIFFACGGSSSSTPGYGNPRLLVSGAWLATNISNTNQVIVDARASSDYAAGHVPGAINIDPTTSTYNSASTAGIPYQLSPITDIAAALGAAGVSNSATIIVYGGNGVDPNAGRLFWELEYVGATDVRVLDGGYAKWTADGRATNTTATTPAATAFTANVAASRLAIKTYVLAHYADTANYVIVDSRDATDPTPFSPSWLMGFTQGHIPNAVNILVGDYLNADYTVKSYHDLGLLLSSKNVTPSKKAITMCWVGVRSAQGYFVLRLMGYDVSNYDGSWSEWVADPTDPTATGA